MYRGLLISVLFFSVLAMADGTVTEVTFTPPSLGYEKVMYVYLPEGYSTDTRYSVVYFLHGIGNPPIDFGFTAGILDELIESGAIEPLIFVRPNGQCPPYAGSMYVNSELYGAYEDYVVHDVIDYIDTHYSTLPYHEARAVMGHSMGGYGAFNAAFKHPELYGTAISLSGFVGLNDAVISAWSTILIAENGGSPPYDWNPMDGWFTGVVFTGSGAFSPNLSNPPYMVDFPLDEYGQPVQSTADHWLTHMPAASAAQYLTPTTGLRILLDCGTQDELGFFSLNQLLAYQLTMLSIPFEFTTFEGGHTNHLAERITLALQHLDQQLCSANAGDYRTYTQGQWGQNVCKGNNAACVRDQYFDALYPTGLTVGSGYTLTFTSSAAVGAALPAGGAPSVLQGGMTDPDSRWLRGNGGSLAGEVIALKLNVDFAAVSGHRYIDGLVVGGGYGAFSGMSGGALLSLAEEVLGGNLAALPGDETLLSLHDMLTTINGNFTGGSAADPELMLEWVFGPCGPADGVFGAPPPEARPVVARHASLGANYPNPFNPATSISYDLAEAGIVSLKVYNLMGQEVAVLVNGLTEAGHHSVTFDASHLSSGMYIYRLEANGVAEQRKMLLMK